MEATPLCLLLNKSHLINGNLFKSKALPLEPTGNLTVTVHRGFHNTKVSARPVVATFQKNQSYGDCIVPIPNKMI